MIDRAAATQLFTTWLTNQSDCTGIELCLFEQETLEVEFGWVFFYTSKLYRDTGDFKHAIAGNGPVIIDRATGSLHMTGTAHPVEHYIEEFLTCPTGEILLTNTMRSTASSHHREQTSSQNRLPAMRRPQIAPRSLSATARKTAPGLNASPPIFVPEVSTPGIPDGKSSRASPSAARSKKGSAAANSSSLCYRKPVSAGPRVQTNSMRRQSGASTARCKRSSRSRSTIAGISRRRSVRSVGKTSRIRSYEVAFQRVIDSVFKSDIRPPLQPRSTAARS